MAQFSTQLPVKILGGDVTRTVGALQSTRAEVLTATLTSDTAGGLLTLTLSDFGPRLLLVRHTITAGSYAELRERQALRVEYGRFPHELLQLLRRPNEDTTFLAVLSPENDGYRFEVVQLSDFRLLTHIELPLQTVTDDELLNAVAVHAREAASALATERALCATERERADTAEGALATTREELATTRDELQRATRELDAARAEAADTADLRTEVVRLRPGAERLPAVEAEAAHLREENARLRSAADALPNANAAVERLSTEVHTGNGTIERLRTQLEAARERDRVRNAVMERQETANNEQAGALRRERDARAAAEAEAGGLRRRLEKLRRDAEESEALHAHDRQTIAFLNRELNRRDALMQTPTPDLLGAGAGGNNTGIGAAANVGATAPLPRTSSAARRRSAAKSRESTPRDRGRRAAATPAAS